LLSDFKQNNQDIDEDADDTQCRGELWVFSASQLNEKGKLYHTHQVQAFAHPAFMDYGVKTLQIV
jgi:hypothetical protein